MAIYTTTLETGTDKFCCIQYEPAKAEFVIPKTFIKLAIPSGVHGTTPTAAVLRLYVTNALANALNALPVKSTVAAWDGSSNAAALHGLSLSAQLDAQNIPGAGNWVEFNVLGDTSSGVIEACQSARSYLTFVLAYGSGTGTARYELIASGESTLANPNQRIFDYYGNSNTAGNMPQLVITGEAGGVRYPRPGCAVGGLMY